MAIPSKIRLYVDHSLKSKNKIVLSEGQSHYLCNVMRLKNGSIITCFNANDGEYEASVFNIHKKQTEVCLGLQIRKPVASPDIWLLFTPLKKDRTDFLVEKSVELGVSTLLPVITKYSITDKIKYERVQAQMIDASEQCERMDVPNLLPTAKLENVLKNWDSTRRLFFLDERGGGEDCFTAFSHSKEQKTALLIGPEGGFSADEADMLYNLPFVTAVSLGPRILRAETAAAAALSVWQAVSGDWKK